MYKRLEDNILRCFCIFYGLSCMIFAITGDDELLRIVDMVCDIGIVIVSQFVKIKKILYEFLDFFQLEMFSKFCTN